VGKVAGFANGEFDLEEADGVRAGVGREGVEEVFAEGLAGGALLPKGLGWVSGPAPARGKASGAILGVGSGMWEGAEAGEC
jgi:hypothetical protein